MVKLSPTRKGADGIRRPRNLHHRASFGEAALKRFYYAHSEFSGYLETCFIGFYRPRPEDWSLERVIKVFKMCVRFGGRRYGLLVAKYDGMNRLNRIFKQVYAPRVASLVPPSVLLGMADDE